MATRPSSKPQKARKAAPSRRATVRGRSAPPTLSGAHVKGFLAGLICGGALVLGVQAWRSTSAAPFTTPDPVQAIETPAAEEKPRFDFYTLLPNQQLSASGAVDPADLPVDVEPVQYLLQAGSFRALSDADRRRGELALLGLESHIEQKGTDNGVWHRVYIGPFSSRSEMARARTLTAQAAIDTLLLQRNTDN